MNEFNRQHQPTIECYELHALAPLRFSNHHITLNFRIRALSRSAITRNNATASPIKLRVSFLAKPLPIKTSSMHSPQIVPRPAFDTFKHLLPESAVHVALSPE